MLRRYAQTVDVLIAAVLLGFSVLLLGTLGEVPWVAHLLVVAHTAPLAWRRRAPVLAVGVALLAAMLYGAVGLPVVGLGPAPLVWMYTTGAELDRPRSLQVLAAAEVTVAAVLGLTSQGDTSTIVGDMVMLAVAYLLGDSARRRRDLLELHRDRADQLERGQAEVARRAVAEERLRIARELHDVVAHGMSVVAVQASTGRLALDRADDPAAARRALVVIEETSRGALDEMRRLVGILRSQDDAPTAGREPAPGLGGIEELAARTVAAGLPVSVRVEGDRRPLPPGLELAAYRILQEALTNVARHAPGAPVDLRLEFGPQELVIDVANGSGADPPDQGGAGLGLVGMRERAALYGGSVDAGPTPQGGFRVHARLRMDQ